MNCQMGYEIKNRKIKILIIEDDRVDQMAFKRFVRNQGLPYDYIIASSLSEGKSLLKSHSFDIILMDYMLGEGTAFDLFDEIQTDVPVIMITGAGDEDVAVQAMKKKASDYLKKDIDGHYLNLLPAAVENAIKSKLAEKEEKKRQEQLKFLVKDRTTELTTAYEQLKEEVTERKKAEGALMDAEAKYRSLVEKIPVITYAAAIDTTNSMLYLSPRFETILGFSEEEWRANPHIWLEQLHPDDRERVMDEITRIHKSGEPLAIEYRMFSSDDQIVWFHDEAVVVYDKAGKPQFLHGVMVDITERKKAEQESLVLSHQRLQSCNLMAHAVRNTLTELGYLFSAINSAMILLREQWEHEIYKTFPDLEQKGAILLRLKDLLLAGEHNLENNEDLKQSYKQLLADQERFAGIYLLPKQGKYQLRNKIRPKWQRLLAESRAWKKDEKEILRLLNKLEKAVWLVVDEEIAKKMTHIPEEIRHSWQKLAYTKFSANNISMLDDVMSLLDHPAFNVRHKLQLKKMLSSLKALVDIIFKLEERTNHIIFALKSGEQLEDY